MNHVSRFASFFCLAGCLSALALNACSSTSADSSGDAGTGGPGADGGTGTDEASTDEGGSADGQTSDAPTMGCGTCPSGSSCGSANGIPVCRAASGIPLFSHVFVISMENTSKSTLDAAMNTPYLKALAKTAATGSDYHGTSHPSLGNYVALTSGDDQGIKCDCAPVGTACTVCSTLAFPSGCGCNQAVAHLGDQLEAGGKTWKAYGEDMGTACNVASVGGYAPKHMPFLYYANMQAGDAGARCTSHVVPYTAFAADLGGTTPAFSFIAPSLNNDMHGTGLQQAAADIAQGDTWLSTNAKAILDSAAFKNGGLLVIVWDEDDSSGGLNPLSKTDNPVPIFVLSPYAKTSAPNGYVSAANGNHFSLLATLEDGLNLPRIGSAVGKTPLADYFPAN